MVKALIAAVWKAEIYCQANVKLWGPPIRSLGRLRSLKKNTEAVWETNYRRYRECLVPSSAAGNPPALLPCGLGQVKRLWAAVEQICPSLRFLWLITRLLLASCYPELSHITMLRFHYVLLSLRVFHVHNMVGDWCEENKISSAIRRLQGSYGCFQVVVLSLRLCGSGTCQWASGRNLPWPLHCWLRASGCHSANLQPAVELWLERKTWRGEEGGGTQE